MAATPQSDANMEDVLPVFDLAPLVRLLEETKQTDDAAPSSASPPPSLAARLDADPQLRALCQGVAQCLAETSCLLVRDPRVPPSANDAFLDALQAYFARPDADKRRDARPALHYQVGATPPGVETPRCVADPASCASALASQRPGHEAVVPRGPDAKWRFFWRVGERPRETAFPELNAPQVVPSGCERWWPALLDSWGGALLSAAEAVAVAAAHGLGLSGGPMCLAELMRGGPHLLAPTGSDLSPGGGAAAEEGAVLAGFHQDLNLLTVHGKARYPGLRVWLRGGRRMDVRVPQGCLLLQAGKQLEHVTGGRVAAGWHEVLATRAALELARGRLSQAAGGEEKGVAWRVSSTVFAHVASDATLRPLLTFAQAQAQATATTTGGKENGGGGGGGGGGGVGGAEEEEEEEAWRRRYAPIKAGAQVQAELEAIKLAAVPADNGDKR